MPKSTEVESLGVGPRTLLFQHAQQTILMNTQIWESLARMLNVYSAEQLTKGLPYFVSKGLCNKQVEQEDPKILPKI